MSAKIKNITAQLQPQVFTTNHSTPYFPYFRLGVLRDSAPRKGVLRLAPGLGIGYITPDERWVGLG